MGPHPRWGAISTLKKFLFCGRYFAPERVTLGVKLFFLKARAVGYPGCLPADALFSLPRFYECPLSLGLAPLLRGCAAGFRFDPYTRQCNHEHLVQCDGGPNQELTTGKGVNSQEQTSDEEGSGVPFAQLLKKGRAEQWAGLHTPVTANENPRV